jgi:hypothetical protein
MRGQNYLVGDQLTIPGAFLDGQTGPNDLVVTVTGVVDGFTTEGTIDSVTWVGTATTGSDVYESIGTDAVTRPTNPVDFIRIRN